MSAKYKIIKLVEKYDLTKNDEDKKNLIDALQKYSVGNKLNEEYKNFVKSNEEEQEKEYRYCGCTASKYCGYFINKNGEMKIIEISDSTYKDGFWGISENTSEKEISNICKTKDLGHENGYIKDDIYIRNNSNKISLANDCDIYHFMERTWLKTDESRKLADQLYNSKYPYERVEVHHINNNPDDNRLDNLIYLPRSIHSFAHHSDKKCTCGLHLTKEEFEQVKKYVEEKIRKS